MRHWASYGAAAEGEEGRRASEAQKRARDELVPSRLADGEEFEAALAAALRAGLLSAAAWAGLVYRPTRLLLRLAAIAPFEAAAAREPA